MIVLRKYQQDSLDRLYTWWQQHPGIDDAPLVVVPTGGGKSWIIAELTRLLWETWPEEKPRTLVLVPSKELAEQNAEKLAALLPQHIHLDYYSAAIGRKRPDADVIVATIGSVYRQAHLLGNIKMVIIDEAHLVNPDGAGRYRQLLKDLSQYCQFRVMGTTATPFRGNGVWLTDGKDPLFSGIAYDVPMEQLFKDGYLAPLVRPVDAIQTRIDTDGISTASGDYKIDDLSERVGQYMISAADETLTLAKDRQKWLAFCPTVANAMTLVDLLQERGVAVALVTGETPKKERAQLIADFRAGKLRCLVTVLALAIGFDVPDVDCLIWLRPTISPVLYVQGTGRGLRIADGKRDTLWIDYTDTTARMGPIDKIKGRKKSKSPVDPQAPYAVCDNCGAQVRPASLLNCPECGAQLREPEVKPFVGASVAAVLSRQLASKVNRYPVDKVTYHRHVKPGSPDSMRVEYWSGLRVVAKEWVCFEHPGFAGEKARKWWTKHVADAVITTYDPPPSTAWALEYLHGGETIDGDPYLIPNPPSFIHVNESGKFPEIIRFEWEHTA